MERIFIKMRSIQSRCVVGPEYIPFAGASVHLSRPGSFTGLDSEGVNVCDVSRDAQADVI